MELALIDVVVQQDKERTGVDGDTTGRRGYEQRDRVRKSGVKSVLAIQKVERAIIRRAGGGGGSEDGRHSWR